MSKENLKRCAAVSGQMKGEYEVSEKKRWAIVGAGNGGQAFAAYLGMQGVGISIYDVFQDTVDKLNELGGISISGNGKLTGFGKIAFASTDIEKVIDGAEVIWVILPSIYHKGIAKKMAPYLKDHQTVIINPIAPLGTIEFRKVLDDNGCKADVNLAGTCTLLFACRLIEQGKVHINGQKIELSIAAYPSSRNEQVEELTKPYFQEFKYVSDILAVSFDNMNFEFHPGPTLLYTAMIEKKIDFEYYIDFVPSQIKLVEAIDKERLELCAAYGIEAVDATQTFKDMYGYDGELYEMITNAECYKGIKGPNSLNVRYLIEDVPYALRSIQTLAKIAGIKVTAIDTVINLAYILLGDELDEGRTPANLGLSESTTVDDIIYMCRN